MSKIINAELLDQLGRPKEMVDEMLDRQIENLETQLQLRAKGVGNRVLGMFLVNGTRVQLSEPQIQKELRLQVGLDAATTSKVISELANVGILRITAGGRYEISNSFLARRANQKVEAENRILRTIRATIQDRMTRDELLDKPYLNYIATSLPLLDLTGEELAFVERSKEAVQKEKRQLNALRLVAFLLLMAIAIYAFWSYRTTQGKNQELEVTNQKLKEARLEEQRLREETQNALIQTQNARKAAEIAQQKAEMNATEAQRQKDIAESLREEAEREAQRNLSLRKQAELSETLVQEALDKAETINRIITSWNAASRALQIEDARTKTLVTLEAFKINRDNPEVGNIDHPTIFEALVEAATALDEDLKYELPAAHQGAIRDILVHPNGTQFYSAGIDGRLQQWNIDSWNTLGVPNLGQPLPFPNPENTVFNRLVLDPEGRRLLATGANEGFSLFNTAEGHSLERIPISPEEEIFASGFTPSGDFLAAGFTNFYRYRVKEQKLERFAKSPSNECFIISDSNGTSIFSVQGTYREYAYTLNIESLNGETVDQRTVNFFGTPTEVDYGPIAKLDYKRLNEKTAVLVIGFTSGRLMIVETGTDSNRFSPRDADARKDFKPHQAAISDFAFSPDGKKLAVASLDGSLSLWDLEQYEDPSYQPIVLDRHPDWVMSVAFAKNGGYLISGCRDGSLHFWNIQPDEYATFLCEKLEETGGAALQQQRRLQSISRKSGLIRAYDQLSYEDYRRFFGEGQRAQRFIRQIRVCE